MALSCPNMTKLPREIITRAEFGRGSGAVCVLSAQRDDFMSTT